MRCGASAFVSGRASADRRGCHTPNRSTVPSGRVWGRKWDAVRLGRPDAPACAARKLLAVESVEFFPARCVVGLRAVLNSEVQYVLDHDAARRYVALAYRRTMQVRPDLMRRGDWVPVVLVQRLAVEL